MATLEVRNQESNSLALNDSSVKHHLLGFVSFALAFEKVVEQSSNATFKLSELSWPTLTIIGLGLAWIVWRVYSFTVYPLLHPREPKEVPYTVPFLGHAIDFFRDGEKAARLGREYFNNSSIPYMMRVAGQRMYFVTAPQDINTVYRNTKTLSTEKFAKDMMKSLGVSADGMKKGWGNPAEKPLSEHAVDIFRKQFNPGPNLTSIWTSMSHHMDKALTWDNVPRDAIRSEGKTQMTMSLWTFTRAVLIDSLNLALFNKTLTDLQPNMVQIISDFDDYSWQLIYQLPPVMAKEVHNALAELKSTFRTYFAIPQPDRADAAYMVTALEDKIRAFGLGPDDLATMFVVPMWVTNSNAYKQAFWVLAHILHDEHLHSTIKHEIKASIAANPHLDLPAALELCPSLMAVYNESLRHITSSLSVRSVAADTEIAGKLLRKDGIVTMPYRPMHHDASLWGPQADTFDPARWTSAQKDLTKGKEFRPFGGGSTYCPGRAIALKAVLTFVGIAFTRFDVRLPEGVERSWERLARMVDTKAVSVGILPPLEGEDVEVVIRKVG
ncbi:cytochrome P450 [Pseudovirgaria hyperparasitica]|uniref:Cytochrome P450 n=1 Tax=Pseudovirgaria hyperparasitica TaxID=470096 RepID=A0A6A6WCZ7_9PEZI|nr:cytochrome P450 [Pseudovirgaria hyperparasitica]KAF2758981.1 cytochrome P450 [Pseudovirgaria hyperparasitica]